MKKEDIKVGEIYRIVGKKGGCYGKKCFYCEHYPEHLIKVTSILNKNNSNSFNTIHGDRIADEKESRLPIMESHCIFNHEDLESIEIKNWKSLIEKKGVSKK